MNTSIFNTLPPIIIIVEDNDSLRESSCSVLESAGFSAQGVRSAEECLKLLQHTSPACVLSDFKLPGRDGIQLLRAVRQRDADLPFILCSAFGSIQIAVDAMKHGANDFISKPVDPANLVSMIREVLSHQRIINRAAPSRYASTSDTQLLRQSPYLTKLLSQAEHVAAVDTSVLILGESGTGKELLARFIHEHSTRRDQPCIAVNCAAIPNELLESELFGHEEGAFTGATKRRAGVLEVAATGTIFLDEVGDMPPLMQVKLLRALQEHEIRPVGSTKAVRVHPRIIAATNRNLDEALENRTMREDFYFRLAVVTLTLPPLRERRDDIIPLAASFSARNAASQGTSAPDIAPLTKEFLLSYPWPGNVRELENVMERALILSAGASMIAPEHLGIHIPLDTTALREATRTLQEIAAEAVQRAESEAIRKALAYAAGNKSEAARTLGVSYKTLLSKIREYGISVGEG